MLKDNKDKKQFMTSLEELLFKSGKNPNGQPQPRKGPPPSKSKRNSVPAPKKLNISSSFADKLATDFGKRKLGGERKKEISKARNSVQNSKRQSKSSRKASIESDHTPKLSKTAWELFRAQYGEGSPNEVRLSNRFDAPEPKKLKAKKPKTVEKKPRAPQRTLPNNHKEEEEVETKTEATKEVKTVTKAAVVNEKLITKVAKVLPPLPPRVLESEQTKSIGGTEKVVDSGETETEFKEEDQATSKQEQTINSEESGENVEENEVKTAIDPFALTEDGVQTMDKQIFEALNTVRTNPKSMIPLLEEHLTKGMYDRSAIEGAILDLEQKEAVVELAWNLNLYNAARLHVEMAGEIGDMGHMGTDSSTPLERIHKFDKDVGAISALLHFGPTLTADEVMMSLIIDQGDPERRTRASLFAFWDDFGCFTGPHTKTKYMTTLNLIQKKKTTTDLVELAVSAWEESVEEPEGWISKEQSVRQSQGVITVTNRYKFQDEHEEVIEARISHYAN